MGICIRSIKNFRAKFSVFTAPETHSVYMHSSLSYIDTERERETDRERDRQTQRSQRERERELENFILQGFYFTFCQKPV